MNKLSRVDRLAHSSELGKPPMTFGSLGRGAIRWQVANPFGNIGVIGVIRIIVAFLFATGLVSPVAAGPVYEAAKDGDAEANTRLIASGANPNAMNDNGSTPLHVAAWMGYADAVQALLAGGGDPNHWNRNSTGRTPLGNAIWNADAPFLAPGRVSPSLNDGFQHSFGGDKNHPERIRTIDALLAGGADPQAKDPRTGETLLHSAAENGHAHAIRMLIEVGVRANTKDKQGRTPLHLVAWKGPSSPRNPSPSEAIEALIVGGADIGATDNEGNTPLHWAAAGGKTVAVAALVALGADVSARNQEGRTPLDSARKNGKVSASRMLMKAGG